MNSMIHENITRSAIVSLMEFFARFKIEKYGSVVTNGGISYVTRKIINIPCQWASRDKWLEVYQSSSARKAMDPNIREKNPVEMQWILPRISFNLGGVGYDSTRRLQKTQRIDNNYTPASYNLDLDVAIISKSMDEQLQLMEQILPFFAPDLSLDIKLLDGMPPESVPFTLTSVNPAIPIDLSETDERIFTFTYSFVVKLNYYKQKKPMLGNGAIIVLTGADAPGPDIGEPGFFYVQGKVIYEPPTTGSPYDPATIWLKGSTNWKPVYTAPTSGAWIVQSGPPTSADWLWTDIGTSAIPQWYTGTTPPASGMVQENLYYFNTALGDVLKKQYEWRETTPPPLYGDLPLPVDYYYDSVADKYYIKTYSFVVIERGLSNTVRRIHNINTHVHSYVDYIQISQEWIEAQQKILEKFEYFVATADIPNPFV